MTKSVFVIYGQNKNGEITKPQHVTTTAAAAKSWCFDNSDVDGGMTLTFVEFQIGGNGKPRAPKPSNVHALKQPASEG